MVIQTIMFLLYATGLRVREALRLKNEDVDLRDSCLTVRQTKFRKTRLVPFGEGISERLMCYSAKKARGGAQQPDVPFFVGRDGKSLNQHTVECAFERIRKKANVRRAGGARCQPRLHDLRHTFAVHRLISWYRQGVDVQVWLPVLSTYLGHTHIRHTTTYLTMIPALLNQASRRFEKYAFQENPSE
jgi:integrase